MRDSDISNGGDANFELCYNCEKIFLNAVAASFDDPWLRPNNSLKLQNSEVPY